MEIPLRQLKALLKTLEEGAASEFEYQDEKYRIRVALARGVAAPVAALPAPGPQIAVAPAASPAAAAPEADPNEAFITSPFVGTFYRAASPETENFVEVGSHANAGQTLCIVEAMKLMNEIEAEAACTILDILVDNGASVEFGQRLFRIRKD